MPKLNGVFVNEYGTRIIYRGVEYVKTEGKPQAGDIVRHDVDGYSYIPKGSFYELRVDSDGDISFIDEDGDDVEPDDNFTVFRRVVDDGIITTSAQRLKVGDYVKVTNKEGIDCLSGFDIGGIYEVVGYRAGHKRPYVIKNERGALGLAEASNVIRVTDAEVAAARKQAAERVKWAAIGRNVNEYEVGDVVRVVENTGVVGVGDIGVITELDEDGTFRVETARAKSGNWHGPEHVELVAPVESRFDRE